MCGYTRVHVLSNSYSGCVCPCRTKVPVAKEQSNVCTDYVGIIRKVF